MRTNVQLCYVNVLFQSSAILCTLNEVQKKKQLHASKMLTINIDSEVIMVY